VIIKKALSKIFVFLKESTMIRFRPANRSAFAFFLSASAAAAVALGGCRGQNGDYQELVFDLAVIGLTNTAKRSEESDLGRRAEAALLKLKNGVLDIRPILIAAGIGFSESNLTPLLGITSFDEDRDLRGLRIKEKYVGPNATTTLEEDYPVFVNALKPFILETKIYPIQIRDRHQCKDICLWSEYVNWNLDELIREYVDKREHDDKRPARLDLPWKETPPIYMSVLDPNRVHVFVSVYDRAGNESNSIKLFTKPEFDVFKSEYIPQGTSRGRE